jgi:hypothetical protein
MTRHLEKMAGLIFMNNFNFEAERQLLIENLNYLKSLSVEEYTFHRKWNELRHHIEPEREYIHNAQHSMWRPISAGVPNTPEAEADATIMAISQIKPRLIFVGNVKSDESNYRHWEAYRFFLSSHEHNGVPGRFIRILIVDDNAKGKNVLGIASIASDVNSLGDRDTFIGWTVDQRAKGKLNCTAIGSTIVPTQPFGFNFLGGKLIATLLTSKVVRDEWQLRYGDILAGFTTTSLYGPSSMYNGIPWWKTIGATKGSTPVQPDIDIYKKWVAWVKKNRKKEYDEITTSDRGFSGPATGIKTRLVNYIFDVAGIPKKKFEHGFQRGVFFSSLYENTKDFLCDKISENDLVLKPRLQGDIGAIMDWWRPRAIKRYLKLKEENRLKKFSPFYNDMDRMDYQSAKEKYFGDVGR